MKTRQPELAVIEYRDMRFLIMDRPTDITIKKFVEELNKHGVKDLIRVCEPTYETDKLDVKGLRVLDWQFEDGSAPPTSIVKAWLNLLKTRFREEPGCCVAVHCAAGLGRAPVLVAIALIERGMKYEDAVELIRTKRRGAFNAKQLAYLEHYRPKSRLKSKRSGHKPCILM